MSFPKIKRFAQEHIAPLSIMGVVCGMLGYYAVRQLKAPTPVAAGTFHVILLTASGSITKQVSLPEFRTMCTVQQLNQLRERVGWKTCTEERWNNIFYTSTHIICVKKGDDVVGYSCCAINEKTGIIYDMSVLPGHQNQKIGTCMMNLLVSKIKDQDNLCVHLFMGQTDQRLQNFYKKFGFQITSFGMEASSSTLVCQQIQT